MGGGGVVNTVCAVSVMHSLLKLLKLVPAEFVPCGYNYVRMYTTYRFCTPRLWCIYVYSGIAIK